MTSTFIGGLIAGALLAVLLEHYVWPKLYRCFATYRYVNARVILLDLLLWAYGWHVLLSDNRSFSLGVWTTVLAYDLWLWQNDDDQRRRLRKRVEDLRARFRTFTPSPISQPGSESAR